MCEIHVVGAAIRDGDKILAVRRSPEMKAPLKWEFAGGKVELGETHEQALLRELSEELGVIARIKHYIATGLSEDNGKRIILHVYEAEILKGIPEIREHIEMKWVSFDELAGLDWADADIPVCRELVRKYGKS